MKTSTKTVISINNISKIYEGPPPVRALDGVSLEIKEGDFVSIVGQSGSGKSTFLNMIGLNSQSLEVKRLDLYFKVFFYSRD
jgi:putative ABC transport system ATP-binding protein